MSLSYLLSLVGKNVILFNFLPNVFKNKVHKMVESGSEYVLYVDMGLPDRLQHRIIYPGIYFVTDVMIQGNDYAIFLKKQVDLKKFSIVNSSSTFEYFVFSYHRIQYRTDGGRTFDALEFELGGFKHLKFNYKKCIIAKAKNPGRRRIAVCLGDKIVMENINEISCNCDWFTVE